MRKTKAGYLFRDECELAEYVADITAAIDRGCNSHFGAKLDCRYCHFRTEGDCAWSATFSAYKAVRMNALVKSGLLTDKRRRDALLSIPSERGTRRGVPH